MSEEIVLDKELTLTLDEHNLENLKRLFEIYDIPLAQGGSIIADAIEVLRTLKEQEILGYDEVKLVNQQALKERMLHIP